MELIIKNYLRHKETIHGFLWRALQIFGKQGIVFLIFFLCAKLLTPYDFGIYNYILAIIFFLIMFGDFGISTAATKYVAQYSVVDKEKLKGVLFNSGIVILGLTVVISLLVIFIGPWYLKEKYIYVLWLVPMIFLAPMTSLYDGIYRGLKKFKKLAIISLIIGLVSIPIVYYSVRNYGLAGALISQNIFYLILLLGLGLGYRELNFKWNKATLNEITKYSVIIGIASMGYFMFSRINILILERFGYILEIGLYEFANKIMLIMLLPFSILCQVIAPRITATYYLRDDLKIKSMVKKYAVVSFVAGTFFSVLAYFSVSFLIKIFFKEYADANVMWIINLFLAAFPISVVSYILANAFSIYTGDASINAKILLIFGIINTIFIPFVLFYLKFKGFIYFTIALQIFTNMVFVLYYINKLFKKIRGA
jgi:O-antigen/teichoic acid export membrane protein